MKKQILSYLAIALVLSNCTSQAIVKPNYRINHDAQFTIKVDNDFINVSATIESWLLKNGYNVVPFETAKKLVEEKNTAKIDSDRNSINFTSNRQAGATIYTLASIYVTANYNIDKLGVLHDISIRFIDLKSNNVFAVYQSNPGGWNFDNRSIIEKGMKEIFNQIQ